MVKSIAYESAEICRIAHPYSIVYFYHSYISNVIGTHMLILAVATVNDNYIIVANDKICKILPYLTYC